MKKHYWVTRENKNINVSEMTLSHINNTIGCIFRKTIPERYLGKHRNNWLQIFQAELKRREQLNKQLYKIC